MSDRPVREVAQSVSRHAKNVHNQHERGMRYADVLSTKPITAALENSDLVLEEENDLTFTQSVRKYDLRTGIKIGDTLVVSQMLHGDWLCHDVVSDSDPYRADHVAPPTTTGTDTDGVARGKITDILRVLVNAGIMDSSTFTRPYSTP